MPNDTKTQIKAILELESPPAVIALMGTDKTRKDRFIKLFKEKFYSGLSDYLQVYKLKDFSNPEKIKLEFDSLSLFTPKKLNLFKNIHELKVEQLNIILPLIKKASADNCILLESSSLKKATTFYKELTKLATVIEFDELKGIQLKAWITRELKRFGINKYSENLVTKIIEISDSDLDQIQNILTILVLNSDGKEIFEEQIYKLFSYKTNPNDFKLIDLIKAKNYAQAEILLAELVNSGRSVFPLLALITNNFARDINVLYSIEQGTRSINVRKELGIEPWLFEKISNSLKGVKLIDLVKKLPAFVEADSKLKNKNLGEDLVLSDLIQELCV